MARTFQLSYRRKFFLGGYETEDIEVSKEVQIDEDPKIALDDMKQFVHENRTVRVKNPIVEVKAPSEPDPLTEKLRALTQEKRQRKNAKVASPGNGSEVQQPKKGT